MLQHTETRQHTWTFLMELGEMSRPGEEIGRVRALFMATVTARSQAERPLRFLWVKHRVFQGDVGH